MRRFFLLLVTLLLVCTAAQAGVADLQIDPTAETLDLNVLEKLTERDMNTLAGMLNAAPALLSCDLSAVSMQLDTMASLVEQCPQIEFHFTVPGRRPDGGRPVGNPGP